MAKRSSGYFDGGRAKKIPGGSKQAVQRNATSSTGAVRFREMTTQGLLLALSTATGTRAAAIERELSHRGVNRPTSHSTQENKDDASKPLPGESDYQRSDPNEALHKHVPDLPGYKIDALGRQRPDYLNPGRVSEVERVAASGERMNVLSEMPRFA
ncbi:MAG: hypothetical protein EOM20_19695 [Spartobacteria bacterium]|nr:hypothetical protein [Spartobacteria bacterium]